MSKFKIESTNWDRPVCVTCFQWASKLIYFDKLHQTQMSITLWIIERVYNGNRWMYCVFGYILSERCFNIESWIAMISLVVLLYRLIRGRFFSFHLHRIRIRTHCIEMRVANAMRKKGEIEWVCLCGWVLFQLLFWWFQKIVF